MRQRARIPGVGEATLRRAVGKLGAKARIIAESPLLMPASRAKRLEPCQMLVNDRKSAPAGMVTIFSGGKTWTVDPVGNRRNDRYLSIGAEDESAALCQKQNIQHPSCRSVSLHPMAQ